MSSFERFLDKTGDDTLRRLYALCGDMELAQELFVEIYVAVYRCPLSMVPGIRYLFLSWVLLRVKMQFLRNNK